MTEIVGTIKKEIAEALKNDFSDGEDSIQYSTSVTIKNIDIMITRNVKIFRNSSIAVMTSFKF